MLLSLAIGDALGSGFEYAAPLFVSANNDGRTYRVHPKHDGDPGRYTDDTQMSLAIAEALISSEPWTPTFLADKFFECFKRDQRTGYSRKFYSLLAEVSSGRELLERLGGNNRSDRSGGAMRATPLGVLPAIGDILKKCRIQAAITHDTTDGMNAACAASLMTHYFIYGLGPKKELGVFIQDFIPGPWSAEWVGPVGEKGWQSVRAAITAVVQSSTMTELAKACIGYTGDVDTVAAIACAAAEHCPEIENDFDQTLYDGLENGTFGREYLMDIDRQLMELKGDRE